MAPIEAGVDATIEAMLHGYADASVDSPLPEELQKFVEALDPSNAA